MIAARAMRSRRSGSLRRARGEVGAGSVIDIRSVFLPVLRNTRITDIGTLVPQRAMPAPERDAAQVTRQAFCLFKA
ncbi:hypothetical protein GCM10025787_25680 [Saccharopolyspora rosea]